MITDTCKCGAEEPFDYGTNADEHFDSTLMDEIMRKSNEIAKNPAKAWEQWAKMVCINAMMRQCGELHDSAK